jgi:hypothetical protein
MAASAAQIVRTLQLAAIVAFVECLNLQRIMAAAIAAAMRGYFTFWDSHCRACSLKNQCFDQKSYGRSRRWAGGAQGVPHRHHRLFRRSGEGAAYTGFADGCKPSRISVAG